MAEFQIRQDNKATSSRLESLGAHYEAGTPRHNVSAFAGTEIPTEQTTWKGSGMIRTALLLIATVYVCACSAWGASLPGIEAVACAQPPTLDGDLDDACWEAASAFRLRNRAKGDGDLTAGTMVRLVHDDRWLYVGVLCEAPGGTEPGPETVETFIQPHKDRPFYYHFVARADGSGYQQSVTDQSLIPGPERGLSRNTRSGILWQKAIHRTQSGWTLEMAFPLYLFGQEIGPHPAGFNVTRYIRSASEAQTWAPVGPGNPENPFHDCRRFGELTGLDGLTVPAMCAPVIARAGDVSPYREVNGQLAYGFAIEIINNGGRAGNTTVVVEDRPSGGEAAIHTFDRSVKPLGAQRVEIQVPVSFPGDRTARVTVKDPAIQAPPWASVEEMNKLISLMAYPGLSVYTDEAEGHVVVGTAFSNAMFTRLNLNLNVTVRNRRQRPVLKKTFKHLEHQGVEVACPVGAWSPGDYPVDIEIRGDGGKRIAVAQTTLRMTAHPPKGIDTTKIDHKRMCLLVEDQPFFPVGFMSLADFDGGLAYDPVSDNVKEVDVLRRFADGGCNTIVDWYGPGRHSKRTQENLPWREEDELRLRKLLEERREQYIKAFEQYGLRLIVPTVGWITTAIPYNKDGVFWAIRDHELTMQKLPMVIDAFKDLPGLLAWRGIDEPILPLMKIIYAHSALIRRLDPFHVQYTTMIGSKGGEEYRAYEIYGRHGYYGPDNSPNRLASRIRGGYQTAKMARKPMFATPQGQRMTYRRLLTPAHQRCGIYLCLINGAKGLFYFTYRPAASPMHEVTWRSLAYSNHEIRMMAPMLLQRRPPQNVVCHLVDTASVPAPPPLPPARTLFDPSFDGDRGPGPSHMPVVQALIQDMPESGEILLVANSAAWPVTVGFGLSSIGPDTRVRDFFTGEPVDVEEGGFIDTFQGYGVRVYETLESQRDSHAPVSLAMNVQEHKKTVERENLIADGGFEKPLDQTDNLQIVGPVSRESGDVHSGGYAALLAGSDEEHTTLSFVREFQPHTTYRASLWAKKMVTECVWRPEFRFVIPPEYTEHVYREMIEQEQADNGWARYARAVTIKDRPVPGKVQVKLRKATKGHVLVDDVRLTADGPTGAELVSGEEQAVTDAERESGAKQYAVDKTAGVHGAADDLEQSLSAMQPVAAAGNRIMNSSFEENTIPGFPDHWYGDDGSQGNQYNVDDTHAFDGTHSLLIQWGVKKPGWRYNPAPRKVVYRYWTDWEYNTKYTLSFYARSNVGNASLRMSMSPLKSVETGKPMHKDFTVDDDWKRFSWTFTVPDRSRVGAPRYLSPGFDNTSVERLGAGIWIDAVQLEEGRSAGPYRRDPYQAESIDPKWLSDKVYEELRFRRERQE